MRRPTINEALALFAAVLLLIAPSCASIRKWGQEPAEERPPVTFTPAPTEENPNPEPIIIDGAPPEGGPVEIELPDGSKTTLVLPASDPPETKGEQATNDAAKVAVAVTGVPLAGLLVRAAGQALFGRRREDDEETA